MKPGDAAEGLGEAGEGPEGQETLDKQSVNLRVEGVACLKGKGETKFILILDLAVYIWTNTQDFGYSGRLSLIFSFILFYSGLCSYCEIYLYFKDHAIK